MEVIWNNKICCRYSHTKTLRTTCPLNISSMSPQITCPGNEDKLSTNAFFFKIRLLATCPIRQVMLLFYLYPNVNQSFWDGWTGLVEIWVAFTAVNNCLTSVNSLRPRQNGRHFADDTFKRIFLNENVGISIKISLKFVPKGPISNIPALVQIMAWRRPGDKPLTEPMVVRLLTHICVTRPQWVK